MENTRKTKTDTRSGWVIVASTFMIGFITDGFSFTFGILMVELLEQFKESRAKTALIISVMQGTTNCTAVLAGVLCKRYGHRVVVVAGSIIASSGFVLSVFANGILHLTLTYGLLGGLGFGLAYTPGNICVLQHFEKRRSLAAGVAICGSGVGGFCISRLLRILINHYTWRGAILIEAGIVMNLAVCGLLLKQPKLVEETQIPEANSSAPENNDNSSDTNKEICVYVLNDNQDAIENEEMTIGDQKGKEGSSEEDVNPSRKDNNKMSIVRLSRLCNSLFSWNILKDVRCWLFLFSVAMFELGSIIPLTFLPDQGTEEGMSEEETDWLISSIGISNTVSRACMGFIGDLHFVNRMVIMEVILFLAGLSTGFSFVLKTFNVKTAYACFYGFLVGGYTTLRAVVSTDVFGVKVIFEIYGLVTLSVGISDIISTPLGGWLFDTTGSYDVTFISAGSAFLLSWLLLLVLHILLKRRRYSE